MASSTLTSVVALALDKSDALAPLSVSAICTDVISVVASNAMVSSTLASNDDTNSTTVVDPNDDMVSSTPTIITNSTCNSVDVPIAIIASSPPSTNSMSSSSTPTTNTNSTSTVTSNAMPSSSPSFVVAIAVESLAPTTNNTDSTAISPNAIASSEDTCPTPVIAPNTMASPTPTTNTTVSSEPTIDSIPVVATAPITAIASSKPITNTNSTSCVVAPKARLRGVVFDMDGTLNVPAIDFPAMHKAVLGEEEYISVKSKSPTGSIDILRHIENWSPDKRQKAHDIIVDYERQGNDRLQVMPGYFSYYQH